jgi:hypothetical protein
MNGIGIKGLSRGIETVCSGFAVSINWNHPFGRSQPLEEGSSTSQNGIFREFCFLWFDVARDKSLVPVEPTRAQTHSSLEYSLVWRERIRLLRLEPIGYLSAPMASRLTSSIPPSFDDAILRCEMATRKSEEQKASDLGVLESAGVEMLVIVLNDSAQ